MLAPLFSQNIGIDELHMTEIFIVIQTTVSSKNDAHRIAKAVTEERLCACAQIEGPITSCYWWQGVLEMAEEWKCSFKTAQRLFERTSNKIKSLHPYETPEIVAVPIINGSPGYLAWLEAEIQK